MANITFMLTLVLLMLFSFSVMLAMIYVRLLALAKGRVKVERMITYPIGIVVEEYAKRAKEQTKRVFLIVVARTLYAASKGLDSAKGIARRQVVKMEEKLVQKDAASKRQGAVSLFLKDIAEHKRIMKMKWKKDGRVESNN